ncbi:MAG: peptidase S1, partial [Terracidiphilus sp.]
MKLRQLVLVLLLVGGFWFVTTHYPGGLNPLTLTGTRASSSPLELTEAEAAPAFDAEEQNNISVYRRLLPSVVNITSRAVVFNFFYGTVPQEGQG